MLCFRGVLKRGICWACRLNSKRYTTQLRTQCFSQTLLATSLRLREHQHIELDTQPPGRGLRVEEREARKVVELDPRQQKHIV